LSHKETRISIHKMSTPAAILCIGRILCVGEIRHGVLQYVRNRSNQRFSRQVLSKINNSIKMMNINVSARNVGATPVIRQLSTAETTTAVTRVIVDTRHLPADWRTGATDQSSTLILVYYRRPTCRAGSENGGVLSWDLCETPIKNLIGIRS